jgi:galactokinase
MNLIGEHTDYNQGFVLPAAIDRHVAVAVRVGDRKGVVITSDRYPQPVDLPSLPSVRSGTWADYALGVGKHIGDRLNTAGTGFEAAIVSEIPIGAGLSSSGALEVATGLALLGAHGIEMHAIEIARLCQRAENDFVGARTGIMDQFTALNAHAGKALLIDCRSLRSTDVPLPEQGFTWLLADTRVHHKLASSAYNDRRLQCEAAARVLGVSSLRDAGEGDLDRIKDPVLRRRARHVVSENARVLQAVQCLERGSPHELGPLLYASHSSLRDDFAVSCAELDCLVDLARGTPHIIGARMMGGGFGGCVLALVESVGIEAVEKSLADGYVLRFPKAPALYRVHPVDGALALRGSQAWR